ncbi:MacB family efflux pump subunit [Gilvimarinus sp. 1_MG-2023]|uniref:MacB family efflux pump subunit n=1 Tax=Gilvimarinus sp. 1_MG-2023 TaxID=3062638 RepID=UPI0026E119EC|nr:MacB family efflux pump subunit [Gilvimarinus sp. 1_MG-2023]MDO6747847.1 MacB family efflux pump subunit [Gilvimarinus sp. 1_MG-2023]
MDHRPVVAVVVEVVAVASNALINLSNIGRYYQLGETRVDALKDVSLTIERGEFVAIMGQSGSGKSTLMNILGCLDQPSSGTYEVDGINVAELNADELSALRLNTFGFVFQRYQLLANITALDNVAMPGIYKGQDRASRRERAGQLLQKLGMGERAHHKPSELSGGQQQRVSIARALINGAEVILADEPTGALDSQSGEQVLDLLQTLNREGVTIILITHDRHIAEHAERVVSFKDGQLIDDTGASAQSAEVPAAPKKVRVFPSISLFESARIALGSLRVNLFRTLLTLLGIIIGVASVVLMIAIGEGGKAEVLERIESIGTNLISVRPGGSNLRRDSGNIATLTVEDAEAIEALPGVKAVAPERNSRSTLRYGNKDYSGRIRGTTPSYFTVRDWELSQGVFFEQDDIDNYASVMVVGATVAESLFDTGENPIGRFVLVNSAPYQIIGLLKAKGSDPSGQDMDDEVLIPLTTARLKMFGRAHLSSITIQATDTQSAARLETDIETLLVERHQAEDVQVRSTESLVQAVTAAQDTLTLLLGSIAAISLFVGGIGVMNIMLVNVSERRREIGLRIATGAKPSDILRQFNIEALVVCFFGGVLGIIIGFAGALVVRSFDVAITFTLLPAALAFATSIAVGLVFGFIPARKAARLNPITALAEE